MSIDNDVRLIGRVGKDPDVRHIPSGTAVARFSLATSETFVNKSGDKQEVTQWHRIVAWGKTAENCGKYLSKGMMVAVQGKLTYNEWEKDGVKRKDAEVVIEKVKFLGRGSGQAAGAGPPEPEDLPF